MDLEVLEKKLKAHDWLYEYTDQYSKWQAGRRQRLEIQELVKELGPEAEKLYNSYRDKYIR